MKSTGIHDAFIVEFTDGKHPVERCPMKTKKAALQGAEELWNSLTEEEKKNDRSVCRVVRQEIGISEIVGVVYGERKETIIDYKNETIILKKEKKTMNKYKIVVGLCGPHIIKTNVINAHDEREAVIKYLKSMDEEPTEEAIEKHLKWVVVHTPKPRKKKES